MSIPYYIFSMTSQPSIPTLVLIPDNSYLDYQALYAIATAYAHSGLVISDHGKKADRPEFSFPAVVCSSFAIELFLKFFLMLEKAENAESPEKHESGHHISQLWNKIRPDHQALIAGMLRNKTGEPHLNASARRIELFLEALSHVGDAPFIKWRYIHELDATTIMSHAAINEVLDALGYAADYVMKGNSGMRQSDKSTPEEVIIAPDLEDQETLIKVRGSERLLLGRHSVLRRIPVNVDPKQAIFLDGIRHAVEIMDVAYSRLRDSLTNLALTPPASDELPDIFSHILLDAWAFIDAVDRFCILYMQMPGIKIGSKRDGIPTLQEATQEFQNLRNVADHLAQRADLVVSQNGTAFGELSWLTGVQLQPEVIAWHCTLRPGTLRSDPAAQTNPIVSTLDWPTDSIRLSAGGYEGNLSQVRTHIAIRIRHLEAQLQSVFQQPTQAQVPVLNDMFVRRPVKRHDPGYP
ncbi:hypothetical protein [Methylobacter tundripaludum]|uniref:hypothetical protein n=1 Tax=Methylobacter tundripaludum TaxID=173365 RepID=UPI000AC0B176|nr:hypothetical protein [Methylobacter tundripaludum]